MSFDNQRALAEGWDLFEVAGRVQLPRIDCPSDHAGILDYTEPKFQSDAHAIVEVATKARAGSAYHWGALHLMGALACNLEPSGHYEERTAP